MTHSLENILKSVDWNANVAQFCGTNSSIATLQRGCHLVSVWNFELGFQNIENPALPFLQEMKASLFYAPACFSLGLYKPAASSMRAAVENALYYSYFCHHTIELSTLLRDNDFYITKSKIIDYHNIHSPSFKARQRLIGFTSELEAWYSKISAIVHGQIPGIWSSRSLADTTVVPLMNTSVVKEFSRAVQLINYLFLLTTDSETWEGFSSQARQLFLKGMSGQKRKALNLALV